MKYWMLLLITLLALPAFAGTGLYDIPLKTLDGQPTSLAEYKGKVLLIVNVASKCGNTPQYAGLEALYQEKKDDGLVVLGFPCNDFGNQEPGTAEEIQQFCSMNYGVTFPLFEKLHVKGEHQHPLYALLSGPESPFPGDVGWNFGKFLIDREGHIIARFKPGTKPDTEELRGAVLNALEE